ncbi:MAG: putative toxin-antitoxin system toxin component, PIN family [Planctomycetes bacterium]|nr:putative toxin-antitoxin system toxin component, PIN family [Planctomycetota bacterium]
MKRLRVVLDANVYVSALIQPAGPPGRILRRWVVENPFELVASRSILEELRQTIGEPRVRKRIAASDEEIEAFLISMQVLSLWTPGRLRDRWVPADPDDDIYVAAAREANAAFIVSGDHHLLELGAVEGTKIVSPRRFLEILKDLSST